MNCTSCGNDNPDHARFCGHCGASLDPPASGRGRTVEVIDIDVPATGQPRVSAGLKWGILAVTLVLWPVGMAMGLFYWIKARSPQQAGVGRLWFFVALAVLVIEIMIAAAVDSMILPMDYMAY